MMSARPPSSPAARAARVRSPGRGGVVWDALITLVLAAILVTGVSLDVRAYHADKGKIAPVFRVVGTPVGERVAQNEFLHETASVVHLGNIGGLEQEDPADRRTRFRWAMGPVSTVEIWSVVTRMRVEMRLRSQVDDQTITVACNGRTLEQIHLDKDESITRRYAVELHPGATDQFTLTFGRYLSHGFDPGNGETRPLAAQILALDLFLPNANDDF